MNLKIDEIKDYKSYNCNNYIQSTSHDMCKLDKKYRFKLNSDIEYYDIRDIVSYYNIYNILRDPLTKKKLTNNEQQKFFKRINELNKNGDTIVLINHINNNNSKINNIDRKISERKLKINSIYNKQFIKPNNLNFYDDNIKYMKAYNDDNNYLENIENNRDITYFSKIPFNTDSCNNNVNDASKYKKIKGSKCCLLLNDIEINKYQKDQCLLDNMHFSIPDTNIYSQNKQSNNKNIFMKVIKKNNNNNNNNNNSNNSNNNNNSNYDNFYYLNNNILNNNDDDKNKYFILIIIMIIILTLIFKKKFV